VRTNRGKTRHCLSRRLRVTEKAEVAAKLSMRTDLSHSKSESDWMGQRSLVGCKASPCGVDEYL
jgi:hypothetical protein